MKRYVTFVMVKNDEFITIIVIIQYIEENFFSSAKQFWREGKKRNQLSDTLR